MITQSKSTQLVPRATKCKMMKASHKLIDQKAADLEQMIGTVDMSNSSLSQYNQQPHAHPGVGFFWCGGPEHLLLVPKAVHTSTCKMHVLVSCNLYRPDCVAEGRVIILILLAVGCWLLAVVHSHGRISPLTEIKGLNSLGFCADPVLLDPLFLHTPVSRA